MGITRRFENLRFVFATFQNHAEKFRRLFSFEGGLFKKELFFIFLLKNFSTFVLRVEF